MMTRIVWNPRVHVQYLVSIQNGDGGWGLEPYQESSPHNTGEVLSALTECNLDLAIPAIRKAADFLARVRGANGGWSTRPSRPSHPGDEGEATATAWAVRALSGVRTHDCGDLIRGGLAFLMERRTPDGWTDRKHGRPSVTTTTHVLSAFLHGVTFLNPESRQAAEAGLAWLSSIQNPDGGFGFFPGDRSRYAPSLLAAHAGLMARRLDWACDFMEPVIHWVGDRAATEPHAFLNIEGEPAVHQTLAFQYEHFTPALALWVLGKRDRLADQLLPLVLSHVMNLQQPGGGFFLRPDGRVHTWSTAQAVLALVALERTARDAGYGSIGDFASAKDSRGAASREARPQPPPAPAAPAGPPSFTINVSNTSQSTSDSRATARSGGDLEAELETFLKLLRMQFPQGLAPAGLPEPPAEKSDTVKVAGWLERLQRAIEAGKNVIGQGAQALLPYIAYLSGRLQ